MIMVDTLLLEDYQELKQQFLDAYDDLAGVNVNVPKQFTDVVLGPTMNKSSKALLFQDIVKIGEFKKSKEFDAPGKALFRGKIGMVIGHALRYTRSMYIIFIIDGENNPIEIFPSNSLRQITIDNEHAAHNEYPSFQRFDEAVNERNMASFYSKFLKKRGWTEYKSTRSHYAQRGYRRQEIPKDTAYHFGKYKIVQIVKNNISKLQLSGPEKSESRDRLGAGQRTTLHTLSKFNKKTITNFLKKIDESLKILDVENGVIDRLDTIFQKYGDRVDKSVADNRVKYKLKVPNSVAVLVAGTESSYNENQSLKDANEPELSETHDSVSFRIDFNRKVTHLSQRVPGDITEARAMNPDLGKYQSVSTVQDVQKLIKNLDIFSPVVGNDKITILRALVLMGKLSVS
tara:strand:+ start:3910 stop:5112 length:1203 start_codon:yes stop_codon:yes gene_type:complete